MVKRRWKSWKTLASESKARRKVPLTPAQIEKLDQIFEQIEKEQENFRRKTARQPEA